MSAAVVVVVVAVVVVPQLPLLLFFRSCCFVVVAVFVVVSIVPVLVGFSGELFLLLSVLSLSLCAFGLVALHRILPGERGRTWTRRAAQRCVDEGSRLWSAMLGAELPLKASGSGALTSRIYHETLRYLHLRSRNPVCCNRGIRVALMAPAVDLAREHVFGHTPS